MTRRTVFPLAGIATGALLVGLYARIEAPWWLLGWVCFVPWIAVLDSVRTLRGALGCGVAMSVALVLVLMSWFAETIQLYTGTSYATALATVLLAAPLLEPQLLVFAVVRHAGTTLVGRAGGGTERLWYVALAGTLAYVGTEWVPGKLFGETLGHGLFGSRWLRQGADLVGAHGLTFALLLVNECVYRCLAVARGGATEQPLRKLVVPLTVIVVVPTMLLAYGAVRCRQIETLAERAPKIQIAAVQANISQYDRMARELGTYRAVRFILDAHYELSLEALRESAPDLVVWPETVYPTTFGSPKSPEGAEFDREIARFVAAARRPFVFGSYDVEGGREYNAAVFLAPERDGRVSYDVYRKVNLFPFTERVPSFLDTPWLRQHLPWLGTWTEGETREPVRVDLADGQAVLVAPLICYDALDPELALLYARQGAQVIVTISNDSWFAAGPAPRQHLVIAAFRSIETRLPQVRATNTGISAAITATGDIVRTLNIGERGVLHAQVAVGGTLSSLVVQWGNWFPPVAWLAALGLWILPRWVRRR